VEGKRKQNYGQREDNNQHRQSLLVKSTSDSKAFYTSHVYNLVQDFSDGYFVVGDNANILTGNLIIPQSGKNQQDSSKNAFNSFLSQLCIRMEQSFGLLIAKWRIFKRPWK